MARWAMPPGRSQKWPSCSRRQRTPSNLPKNSPPPPSSLSANAEELIFFDTSTAIEQISKAAGLQAKAAEASDGLGKQLREAAKMMEKTAEANASKAMAVKDLLTANKVNVDQLIANISGAAKHQSNLPKTSWNSKNYLPHR